MTPLEYEIRVSGLVPEDLLAEIEGVHVVVEPVQRLGLDLIEVRRLSDETSP